MTNQHIHAARFLVPVLALLILVALLAAPVSAQVPDQLHLYFDQDYNWTHIYPDAYPAIVEGYLVLDNITASSVGGWEGRLTIDGSAQLIGTELAGLAINGLNAPDFWVGLGEPLLPQNTHVLLATFQFLAQMDEPSNVSLVPLFFSSLPDQVSYLNGDGSGEILPMYVSQYEPLGRIGCAATCGVANPDVLFQEVGVGQIDTSGTYILNYQFECRPLQLDIGFAEPCPEFYLTGASGPIEMQNKAFPIPVVFAPLAPGFYQCLLNLGDICSDVTVSGICRDPAVGLDHLGIFFDEHFTQYEAWAAGGSTVTAHLVLLHPSDYDRLQGWEACVTLTGGAQMGDWTLTRSATNTLTAPCVQAVMDSRVDQGLLAVELATFEIILPPDDDQEVQILLGPIPEATLPGQMSWVINTDDGPDVRPLSPYLEGPAVAWINPEPVGVTALMPSARLFGSIVTLAWPTPGGDFDDCRVYRRQDQGTDQLLAAGVRPVDGHTFTYRDDLPDHLTGTTLFYSYALLKNGQEVARSPEVAVKVSSVPAALTRLLPSVPNPFNPMTEIRFEMRDPGAVRVTVHDVTGRLVRTLVEGDLPAGPHRREWFGQDDQGRPVPSGGYYIRLETGSQVDHGKVMLLK